MLNQPTGLSEKPKKLAELALEAQPRGSPTPPDLIFRELYPPTREDTILGLLIYESA